MTISCVDGRMYRYVHTRTKTIDFLPILCVIRGGDIRSQKSVSCGVGLVGGANQQLVLLVSN